MSRHVADRIPGAVGVMVLILAVMLGCSSDPYGGLRIDLSEIDGEGTLALSAGGGTVKAVVAFFHGADQTVAALRESAKHKEFFAPFLRAGFAVVASDAGGNAFGSTDSRANYRRLIHVAESKWNVKVTVFVAESMGALPALALLSEDTAHRVKATVGITPLMGLPRAIRSTNYIASQWAGGVPDSADPMSWPPEVFNGDDFRLYQAKEDKLIPQGATAVDFAAKFKGVARISLINCEGQHADSSCYQGSDVAKWVQSLG